MSDRVPIDKKVLLTQGEVCLLCGIDPKTFRAEMMPTLRGVPFGRRWKYPRVELDKWIARQAQQTADRLGRS